MTAEPDGGIPRFDEWEGRGTPPMNHWLRRARQLGLRRDPSVSLWRNAPRSNVTDLVLRGSIAGFGTEVGRRRRSGELQPPREQWELDWCWSIGLTGLDLQGRLTLAPETSLTGLGKLVTGQDILTGDREFDELALVRGEPAYALAVLSEPVRRTIALALSRGVRFVPDGISWIFWDRSLPRRILSRARNLAILATRLRLDEEGVRRGLQRNAVRESLIPVRRRNLEELAALLGPPTPASLQAALAAAATYHDDLVSAAAPLLARALRYDVLRLDELGERTLVCLLRFGPDEQVLPVIDHLARRGTAWCLPALCQAASSLLRGRRRQAAQEARERITAREKGSLPQGGLSLVGEGGDLSLIPKADEGLEFAD